MYLEQKSEDNKTKALGFLCTICSEGYILQNSYEELAK